MIYDLQRASMHKRISAYLFDTILLVIAAVLMALLLSGLLGFDGHYAALKDSYARIGQEYGVELSLTGADIAGLSAEEAEKVQTALAAFAKDPQALYSYSMVLQLALLMITFGVLLAYLLLEFAVPLLFGNGQTLGKKIFGIGVMTIEGIRLSGVGLFVRTVLAKYTIETMIPVMLVLMTLFTGIGMLGPVLIGAIAVFELLLLIFTHNRAMIHDILAKTVTVDMASQMIFQDREAMIAYKQKMHAEKVANDRS